LNILKTKYAKGENYQRTIWTNEERFGKITMNKQLVIIGIIALLITVGSSGCNELSDNANNQNLISFDELSNHLPKYIGKNVTIEGYVEMVIPPIARFVDRASYPNYLVWLNYPRTITLYTGMYRIKGIVTQGQDNINPGINVISAEAI
jgi:uncharacterized membrane protein